MLKFLLLLFSVFLGGSVSAEKKHLSVMTKTIDFDWQFHLGDIDNGQNPDLNTIGWRTLNLPHDWSIEGQYSQRNDSDWQSGFLPAGIGWYRKIIKWDSNWTGKLLKIMFEGIYLNSDVWINGQHLGHRPNGYLGVEYDLTPYIRKGNNVIAVRVDHSRPYTGRWYTGSGIYRHVWLKVKDQVHIKTDGIFFTTPEITEVKATFKTRVTVENNSSSMANIRVNLFLQDKSGKIVASETVQSGIPGNTIQEINFSGTLSNPKLWSPESPNLYSLITHINENGLLVDEETLKVGFRKIEFSSDFGFKLNGKVTKMKGVCDHHTAGSIGSAVPDDVWLYRLRLLKDMGCNSIRTSHNPFSPTFYDICDSLGLMVMNEFLDGWDTEKAAHDYGLYFEKWWQTDAEVFIKRDRNHPSVIIWSIGNEVLNPSLEVQKQLISFFHKYDPTRPVTQGGHDPTRDMEGETLQTLLDIKGFNGDGEEIGVLEDFHAKNPKIPVICTEVPHSYQTRGVYRTQTHWRRKDFPAMWEIKYGGTMGILENRVFPIPDLSVTEVFADEVSTQFYQNGNYYPIENKATWSKNLYYQSSYDNASVRSSARKAWQRTRDFDFVMGQFRWGSFDYLGETNNWPSRFGNFGVIDICGFPKDHFYLYQSLWKENPMVHILPHWTHPGKEGLKIPVVAYTNCDEVELFLNGKSLGIQKYQDEQLVWQVVYEPGTIKAIARKNGKVMAEDLQVTAGKALKIKLIPDKTIIGANQTDVVHIELNITDENGVFCPTADNPVQFVVNGPARIIGVDNGDPLDLSDYKTNARKAFRGKVMLLIQSDGNKGNITVTANSVNLLSAEVNINARVNKYLN